MEFTVVFRNMTPLEALVTLVKELMEERGLTLASSGKVQVSIRKHDSERGARFEVQLSSELARQSWVAVDDAPERAVRTVFARCDQAIAAHPALSASAFGQRGRLAGSSKPTSLSH